MDVKFLIAGDRAVSVEFGSVISLEVNARVRALDEKLKESPIEGMVETVPTYCALIVHYRPEVIRYSRLVEELEKRIADMHEVSTTTKKVVKEIPVIMAVRPDRIWSTVQSLRILQQRKLSVSILSTNIMYTCLGLHRDIRIWPDLRSPLALREEPLRG